MGLARALCAVLLDDGVRTHLQAAARVTALRFTPQAIVDRCAPVQAQHVLSGPSAGYRTSLKLTQTAIATIFMGC